MNSSLENELSFRGTCLLSNEDYQGCNVSNSMDLPGNTLGPGLETVRDALADEVVPTLMLSNTGFDYK